MNTYERIDEDTLKVTTQLPLPDPIITTYSVQFLKEQITAIENDRDAYISKSNEEITKIKDFISNFDVLEKAVIEVSPEITPQDTQDIQP